jgi:GDP-D-mannose dehydratase
VSGHNSGIYLKALICGITEQDGSYLTEFLLGKGYEVQALEWRARISIEEAWLPPMSGCAHVAASVAR